MKIRRIFLVVIKLLGISLVCYSQQVSDAIIYGELYPIQDASEIRMMLWDETFDLSQNRAAAIDTVLNLQKTALLDGALSPRSQDFELRLGSENLPVWVVFEETRSKTKYGPYLLVAGDEIKIKFDQKKSAVVFGGASRYNFEMVHVLGQLLDRANFDGASYLDYSSGYTFDQEAAQRVKLNNVRFRRKVIPVVSRIDRIAKMKSDLSILEDKDFWLQVDFYQKRTPEFVSETILSEMMSRLYLKVVFGFYGYYYRDLDAREPGLKSQFESFFEDIESCIDSFSRKFTPGFSPTYLKMQEYRMLAKSMITGRSVLEESRLEENPDLREAILTGHYLQRNIILKFGIGDLGVFLQEVENPKYRRLLKPWYSAGLPGVQVPVYSFLDEEGKDVSLRGFGGKIVLLNVWMSGCSACKFFNEDHFTRLMKRYGEDEGVVLLALSLDRDEKVWERSIKSGVYAPQGSIHLWTGLTSNPTLHPYLSFFNITSTPQFQLIDQEGRLTGLGLKDKTFEGISSEIEKLKSN